jgi:hypothetical protein
MKNKNENHHGGSYMVAKNLHALLDDVQDLLQMIDENDEVESWMEHKVSVARAAVADVRDALHYDQGAEGCGCGGDDAHADDHGGVEIEVLKPMQAAQDSFGLSSLMGGGCNMESNRYLGSGAINEKKQLVTTNNKQKIIVESAKKIGNLVKVKSTTGKIYEYYPHFGSDLEIMRCENLGIKIRK